MAQINGSATARSMALAATGFGVVGLLAPKALAYAYGLPRTPPFRLLLRMWGTRTAAIGVLTLASEGEAQRNLVLAATALSAADTASALVAGGGLTPRTRLMTAATTAVFAVGGAAVLSGALD